MFVDIPFVVVEKNMQTAFVGLSFEIQCSIQSIPLYTYVYWTRSNRANITLIIPGTVGYEGMTAQNPNLFIPKVDIFMSGEYSCIATNEIGTGYSSATNLTGIAYLKKVPLCFNLILISRTNQDVTTT